MKLIYLTFFLWLICCIPNPVRTKKDAVLSFDFERSMKTFYLKNGHWPLSVGTYLADSAVNRTYLNRLYEHGFVMLEFKAVGKDTLNLDFIFETITDLKSAKDISWRTSREIHGTFTFISYPTGQLFIERKLR